MTPTEPSSPAAPEVPAPGLSADNPTPPDSVFSIQLRPLSFADPLRWLAAGWKYFRRAPLIGLFFGLCFVLMGWAILLVYRHAPIYTLALSAGFLLMGPFVCLGLYQASRRLEQGLQPRWLDCLSAWRKRMSQIAIFGAVLLILEMIWGRAALIVFAVSFQGMPDFAGSIAQLLNPENLGFIISYLSVGALFAGLIYAVSVISIPMLLDRDTDAVTAGLTSMRLVLTQTGVMLFWGALITALVLLAMLPWFIGLLVVGPLLGHASWHAYRAAVAR